MTLSGNPNLRRVVRNSEEGKYTADYETVTIKGMAWKSVILCAVTIIVAVLSAALLNHYIATDNTNALLILLLILGFSAIPLFIVSLIIMFAPMTAKVLGFVYCALEGLVMGVTSALIDLALPGIAIMAFLGTCLVFLVSLFVFNVLGKRLSGKFVKVVLVSFISFVLLEVIGYIFSLFIPVFAAVMNNIWVQLAVSAIMVIWAAFMIMIDLDNMHSLVENSADKKYEWLAAFSLVTTLIWLYFEILELLVKIVAIAKKD